MTFTAEEMSTLQNYLYKNVDEGEVSYDMNMSILDIDLKDAA